MVYLLKLLFKFIYLGVLRVDPLKKVTKVEANEDDVTELFVTSVLGFTQTFKCQRITYSVKYENCFLPDETFKIYKLSAEHSNDIPENLKKVLSTVHYLPSFKSFLTSEDTQRKILIEAYVDLVTREIEII